MAAFGTIYTHSPNPRTTAILAVAKAHGIKLDVILADKDQPEAYAELLKYNPLGLVPTFVGADGYVLTECIAITLYITQQSETTSLLGSSRRDYYEILKWMSFCNGDFLPSIGGCILPLIGRKQLIRMNGDDCLQALHRHCRFTENHLKSSRFLVGDSVTIADYFVIAMLTGLFMVFHPVVHKEYPNLTRWFYEVWNHPLYKNHAGDIDLKDLPFPRLPDHAVQGVDTHVLTEQQMKQLQEVAAPA